MLQLKLNVLLVFNWIIDYLVVLHPADFKLQAETGPSLLSPSSGSNSLFGNSPHKRNFKRTAQA